MYKLRSLSNEIMTEPESALRRKTMAEDPLLFKRATAPDDVDNVIGFALDYPYPHSVLGGKNSEKYVRALLSGRREHMSNPEVDGWYLGYEEGEARAVCHLSIYGVGNGNDHTLWKIRHPMIRCGGDRENLSELFRHVCRVSYMARSGSAKVVIFIGEPETMVRWAAEQAGFVMEGCLQDYYRLNESCLIYGKTVTALSCC